MPITVKPKTTPPTAPAPAENATALADQKKLAAAFVKKA